MRRIVPFWTWTSRNMPLQIEMALRQPKAYNRFQAAQRLVAEDEDTDLVPSWMRDSATSTHLGGGRYLTLDMPFQDVDDMTRQLGRGDPGAVLQSATPLLKAPVEIRFGKQAWNGLPVDDRQERFPLAWSLAGLPQVLDKILPDSEFGRNDDGEYFISNRAAYTVEQAWPLLGRVRRLFPSEERFQQRRMASVLTFFGVGARQVTDREKSNAAWERADTLGELEKRLQGRFGKEGYKPEGERDDDEDGGR